MTPKMQEALDKLAVAGNLPKSTFHHSTVTALIKSGHVEEVPGDSTWIALVAVRSEDLPQRDPAVPVIPIDDEVIGAGRHVNRVQVCACGRMAGDTFHKRHCPAQEAAGIVDSTAGPKAWVRGCPSCKMPMVDNPAHLPGCETLRQPAESVADAAAWVCGSRVKPTRVSRRRAQRRAMAR